jgi:hypothetical protein
MLRVARQTYPVLAIGAGLAIAFVALHSFSSGQSAPAEPVVPQASDEARSGDSTGSVLHKTTYTTPRADPLANAPAKPRDPAPEPQRLERKLPRVTVANRPQQTRSEGRRLIDVAVKDDVVTLNSFGTSSMPLDGLACAQMAEDVVWDHSFPDPAVHILANDDLMHQVRICAANGHILITCYQNTATISLRRPTPRDGCQS